MVSSNNEPLEAVTIVNENNQAFAVSDKNGTFTIEANMNNILLFTFVGMVGKKVRVNDNSFLSITLAYDIASLEKVVAIGYGTVKRRDITGAVDRIGAKDFNTGVITNPLQQLQGKIAGLLITQPGGDPNGDFTVRLRGATSLEGQPPLLVIDGVAIDDFNKAIAVLNPADIESYDILKDAAAAAIYGSRGANGVILVTTKKAVNGKVNTEYNGFVSLEKISRSIKVLNGDEWRKATAGMNAGGLDEGANIDWQKEISQTGLSHSHVLSIGGGTDQLNFRGSLGYIKQQGVIINSAKETITARIQAWQKSLHNKLELKYGLNISAIKRDLLPDFNSVAQTRISGSEIFSLALQYLPVWPVYKNDGSYYQPAASAISPLFILKEIYSKQNEIFFQGSVKADYSLLKDLKLGMLATLSRASDVNNRFLPTLPGTNSAAEASKANYNKQAFSGDMHLNWHKDFHLHRIDFTGAYEYNKFINDGFGVAARGFLIPSLLNNNLGGATAITPGDIFSYKNEVKLVSTLCRFIYSYNNRYTLTVNFRRDGSSKFGANHRWGNFPSVAVAWLMSDENLFREIKWINTLKLRLSYGLTGNQESLPPDSYQLLYGPAGSYLYNGNFYQSYGVTQEYNPDLKWEVRKSLNIGVDFSFLENRIKGTVDVYSDKTNDMLFRYDLPQPPFLTNAVTANAANAINRGAEISVSVLAVNRKKFTWNVNFNIATLTNKITNLSGQFRGTDLSITNRHYGYAEGSGLSGAYISQLQVGYPAGVFWIPQHAGFDADGHELFNNYDNDGKFTGTSTEYADKDRVFINPLPHFTWAFSNNFSFKHFDCSFLIRAVQGQKAFANSLLNLGGSIYLPVKNVTTKALTSGFADQPIPSTYWIRNTSFARLENATLGYNFKRSNSINSLRLYLTVTNLFVITKYDGIDPEIRTEGPQRYIDRNYYPKTRGFVFGVNASF